MSIFKKIIILKNFLGLFVIGLFFTLIGGIIVVKGASDGSLMPLAFAGIGIVCMVISVIQILKAINRPIEDFNQYDRVSNRAEPQESYDHYDDNLDNEEVEEFIFHYTGKANQSYVMKDHNGNIVYEAITDKVLALKDRPFVFKDHLTGKEETKMVGPTITTTMGATDLLSNINISSTFKVDGTNVWEVIASLGYGFHFTLNGIAAHYDIHHYQHPVGYCELGGTGLMDPKYKNNPLGKIPTNGIFKVSCRRKDIPGIFLICFAITKTELTVE